MSGAISRGDVLCDRLGKMTPQSTRDVSVACCPMDAECANSRHKTGRIPDGDLREVSRAPSPEASFATVLTQIGAHRADGNEVDDAEPGGRNSRC